MLESRYQTKVIKKIRKLLPGCLVLKNDSGYLQGIPDWSIFYGPRWAMLEIKADQDSEHQPNQDWYVDQANGMSFGAFLFPQNEEEVLDGLCKALRSGRASRVPKP